MRTGRGWGLSDELVDYFRTSESVNGLSSSWAPLVGIAMGGAISSSDPESRIVDGRFRLGSGVSKVGRHREIRRALMALPPGDPSSFDCLWVSYGPVVWSRVLDRNFGKGTATKLVAVVDPNLVGIAILAPEVRRGADFALLPEDERGAPGAWLVDLVLVSRSRTKRVTEERRNGAIAKLSEIGRTARTLLLCAEDAYRDARGRVILEAKEARRAVRRSRRLEGLDALDFGGGRR